MSIIPAGNRREQVNQGALKNQSIFDNVLFNKLGQGAIGLDPNKNKKPDQQGPPGSQGPPGLQDTMNSGMGSGMPDQLDQDRNPPQEAMQDHQPGIAPAGGSQPIRAVPDDSVMQEEMNMADQPTFWENLANKISPLLQQRNLRPAGNPKLTDRNENVYDLALMPIEDPRTGQPMKLPPSVTAQLFADAKQIATTSGGIIKGLPYIDERQIWHIPLQIGGGNSQKTVSKPGNR